MRSGKLRLSCFQKACLLIPNSLAAAAWFQSQTRRASNNCDLVSSSCLSSRSSQVSFTTHFPAKSERPSATSHGIVASIASATAFSSIVRRSNAILNSMPATSGDSDAPTAFETIFWSWRRCQDSRTSPTCRGRLRRKQIGGGSFGYWKSRWPARGWVFSLSASPARFSAPVSRTPAAGSARPAMRCRRGAGAGRNHYLLVEAVYTVVAELLGGYHRVQVAVGRRDHQHINFDRPGRSDASYTAVLQQTQQLHLNPLWQFPKLIEEHCPALSFFYQTDVSTAGAGIGPLLMSEQLTFDQ